MASIVIVGAAGYTGGELLRILCQHPLVADGTMELVGVSVSHAGQHCTAAHPDMHGMLDLTFRADVPSDAAVVFLCLGHGASRPWMEANPMPASTIVIDLGNDHRLDEAWTYGLPEQHRARIATATRIANPGCFATCIELALLPLVHSEQVGASIHCTAITGSTGAGQAPSDTTHFSWRAQNLGVYKAFDHQHLPEIERIVQRRVTLIPMRGAFTRGILASTVLSTAMDAEHVHALYAEHYRQHPFTHVVHDLPDVKRVVNTNMCQIGLHKRDDQLLIVSVIDNLMKGASGQAVQNMNIALGINETSGLHLKPSVY